MSQPEDNLDNAFIADRIVELQDAKLKRLFLFVTHNLNIPAFGDAEWIGVSNGLVPNSNIPVENQGSIELDKIRESAAHILEGGWVAFVQRKEKYRF